MSSLTGEGPVASAAFSVLAVPHKNDVLFGRGRAINCHPGNRRFHKLAESCKAEFATSTRAEKRQISLRIMDMIRDSDPAGRFLEEDPVREGQLPGGSGGAAGLNGSSEIHPTILRKAWTIVQSQRAYNKVMHRLRVKEEGGNNGPASSRPVGGDVSKKLGPGPGGDESGKQRRFPTDIKEDDASMKVVGSGAADQSATRQMITGRGNSADPTTDVTATLGEGGSVANDDADDWDYVLQRICELEYDDFEQLPPPGDGVQRSGDEGRVVSNSSQASSAGRPPPPRLLEGKAGDRGRNDDQKQRAREPLEGRCLPVDAVLPGSPNPEVTRPLALWDHPAGGSAPGSHDLDESAECNSFFQRTNMLQEKGAAGENLDVPSPVNGAPHGGVDSCRLLASWDNPTEGSASGSHDLDEEAKWDSFLRRTNLLEEKGGAGEIFDGLSRVNGASCGGVDSFLTNFASQHDDVDLNGGRPRETTLRQWIEKSSSKLNDSNAACDLSLKGVSRYIISAISIALRLTKFLVVAERDGRSISAASITARNVFVRTKEVQLLTGVSAYLHSEEMTTAQHEAVEQVWIVDQMGSMDESPDIGAGGQVMPKLFYLGIILYELFSAGEPPLGEDMPGLDASPDLLSMKSINLSRDDAENGYPKKKYLRQSLTVSNEQFSNCISRLELKGIPWSLCVLVHNLLDCRLGDFSNDETYTSFVNLQWDLELMVDNPSRFVVNIPTNPMPVLEICDKLYGREEEVAKLELSYQQHIDGRCSGVRISGGAGVGKSKFAKQALQNLTNASNGYFLVAKFDQNEDIKPMFLIGSMFSSLCDFLTRDATPTQLAAVGAALETTLGSHAYLVAGIVPSLLKLMPQCLRLENFSDCVDSAISVRYLFVELLSVISSHSSRPITLFLDDMQWSDPVSLLLIGNIIHSIEGSSKLIFCAICYRDDVVSESVPFGAWLSSIAMFSLHQIQLENMTIDSVNNLLSDAMHLTPRVTRSLASVLHRKTQGNPLFLRQLLESLKDQGHIRFQISPPRWVWYLDTISDLKISDDVVALLIKEMQRLDPDLQLGLNVASCIGCTVTGTVLGVLSEAFGKDLADMLRQASIRGFMNHESTGGTVYSFAHDKIQEAAQKLVPEQQTRENHMKIGLALCSHTMDNSPEDNELYFTAVNQVNRGGPNAVHDEEQKAVLAALNYSAGKRSIDLVDYNTALRLFKHGISFLKMDHWTTQYSLTIDLFEAAAEAACVINMNKDVTFFSDQMVAHARCFDDKLNCLYTSTKALRQGCLYQETIDSSFSILAQLGEKLPRAIGDEKLSSDMQLINQILTSQSFDWIFNMQQTKDKKIVTLMKIYSNLADILHFAEPSLVGSVSLRMVDLTIKTGLCEASPLALCYYGETLANTEKIDKEVVGLGCRLGKLAMKLCQKKHLSRYKSHVTWIFSQSMMWAFEPIQSIIDAHYHGKKSGQQAGDFLSFKLNHALALNTSFFAGNHLDRLQKNFKEAFESQSTQPFVSYFIMYHSQILVLRKGLHILNEGHVDNVPTEREFLSSAQFRKDKAAVITNKILQLMRAFLFSKLDHVPLDIVNIWSEICEQKHSLRPTLQVGVFFEGLASYHLARQTNDKTKWLKNGDSMLEKMVFWSELSKWNYDNKMLLLEAEKMHTQGNYDSASSLYEKAILSSHEHKFIHEEAIASELAGVFFHHRGLVQKSFDFLMHSVRCFEKWGAAAVARRVEAFVVSKFGSDSTELMRNDRTLTSILVLCKESSNKRQERE